MDFLKDFVQRLKQEPLAIACEYVRYYRVKSAYQHEGQPAQVRHTFLISAWAQINGMMQPMNAILTRLYIALGSVPKPGPPPRNTGERRIQGSLERLLRGKKQ
eukprot:5213033-Pyramimonas_sp.AAC.1